MWESRVSSGPHGLILYGFPLGADASEMGSYPFSIGEIFSFVAVGSAKANGQAVGEILRSGHSHRVGDSHFLPKCEFLA